MSRSQPSNRIPNPTKVWIELKNGVPTTYDKDKQERVTLPLPLTGYLLDQLASVGGFDQAGNCRIHSNEVRDTTTDTLLVKSFNSGVITEGIYRTIKEKIEAAGGYYVASLYLAFQPPQSDDYVLGNLRLKGVALAAWLDFAKKNAAVIYEKGFSITGSTAGKTGSVVYRIPTFELVEPTPAAMRAAFTLDGELQTYLSAYLKRTTAERADDVPPPPPDITAADIPF